MKTELIKLEVDAKGEVLTSNFDVFKMAVDSLVDSIPEELISSSDFGSAKVAIKSLKQYEVACDRSQDMVLKKMDTVSKLIDELKTCGVKMRKARLSLEKEVKAEEARLKKEIEDDAVGMIVHDRPEKYRESIRGAMKNKKTLESLRSSAKNMASIINEKLEGNHKLLDSTISEYGKSLVPDYATCEDMQTVDLGVMLETRIERFKMEQEAKRLEVARIKAEKELADMKRKEADKARLAAVEAEKRAIREKTLTEKVQEKFEEPKPEPLPEIPEPAKVGVIPVENKVEDVAEVKEADQLAAFIEVLKLSFAPIKSEVEKLTDEVAIEKVAKFRKSLNQAWKELNS